MGSEAAAQPARSCDAHANRPCGPGAPARELPHQHHEATEESCERRRTGQRPVIEDSSPEVHGSGSEGLFDEFFNDVYEEAVLYVAMRAPADDVDDIVGKAFKAAFEYWGAIKNPRAYLYATLRNGVSARYRERDRDARLRRDCVASRPQQTHPDPADLIESKEHLQEVLNALQQLPERMREIALLTLDNYKPGEIADQLGITRSTVTTQLTEANRRLRKIFGIEQRSGGTRRGTDD
ncbi:RNA polymerase sigma factor [Streptomyces collinus]